ncbi:MAG: PLP-dependent aminotransferase family protein [Desulfofustis sp.]
MPFWIPHKGAITRPAFRSIAEQVAGAIQAGVLEPGERLPSQRDLAAALDVSLQTISRAYEELRRRNLVTGEIGRGTFVSARQSLKKMPFGSVRMDEHVAEMSIFKPVVADHHEALMRKAFAALSADSPRDVLFNFRPNEGLVRHRKAGAAWLRLCGLETDPGHVMITNGVTQATTTALLTAAKPGQTIVSEAVGHHSLTALCSFLGLNIKGLQLDRDGIMPEAFDKACLAGDVAALYLIPTLANPTVYLMPEERRQALAEIARRHQIFIIENDILGPLVSGRPRPLSAYAPERSFYLTGFSKCLMPGLRSGYIVVPPGLARSTRSRLLATTWMATPLMAEITCRWVLDGTARKLMLWQRKAMQERNRIARRLLGSVDFHAHPNGFHIWLPLPGRWRSAAFVEQALEQGVAIAPADAFLIDFESEIRAVRVSLGSSPMDAFKRGLRVLKQLVERETEFTITPF